MYMCIAFSEKRISHDDHDEEPEVEACDVQALRRELNFMEAEALKFAAALETASETNCDPTKLTAQLEGRFRFLWGIYRAHSEVKFTLSI